MSKELTYCFLINCASNAFRAENFFKQREASLKQQFRNAEFVYIRGDDSIKEIAAQKSNVCTHIVACGGDGTVSQVANGILHTKAILGVIPLGSGNDFAQSLGLSTKFDQAVSILKKNRVKRIDTVKSDWGYFLNTLGIGADGATSYYAGISKFKSGVLKYFVGGLRALFTSNPFFATVDISGKDNIIQHKTWMVALANGKNEGGGYTISPTSDHADGTFEIVIVHPVSRLALFIEFIKLSLGIPFKQDIISTYSVNDLVSIRVDNPQKIHADGELLNDFKYGAFRLSANSLPVVCT